jgi:hypothetical protein
VEYLSKAKLYNKHLEHQKQRVQNYADPDKYMENTKSFISQELE